MITGTALKMPGAACLIVMAAASFLMTSEAKGKSKNPADYFTLCHRDDPNLNECVKSSILEAKPKLIEGIPDLHLVPMDPLHIPRLEFKDGEGNFEFSMVLKNVTVHGLANFDITSCKIDVAKPHIELDMMTPFMQFESEYEIAGKILVLPIKGNGDMIFNFTGVRTLASVPGKFVSRGGQEYLEIQDFNWVIEVQLAQSYFGNLFNGDKMLGESTNKFLNENWREAFETLKHLPEQAFGALFKDLGNNVFSRFTYDQLFLK